MIFLKILGYILLFIVVFFAGIIVLKLSSKLFYMVSTDARKIYHVEKIDFTGLPKHYSNHVWRTLEDRSLLLELEREDDISELGIYDPSSKKWKKLMGFDAEIPFSNLEVCSKDWLVYTSGYVDYPLYEEDEDQSAELYLDVFSRRTGEQRRLHQFSLEYLMAGTHVIHSMVVHKDIVYFTEMENGEFCVYAYDLVRDRKEVVARESQSAHLYKDKIYVLGKNEDGRYTKLFSLYSSDSIALPKNLYDVSSSNHHLFILTYTRLKKGAFKITLMELVGDCFEMLLISKKPISYIRNSDDLVRWNVENHETPMAYSIKHKKIIKFSFLRHRDWFIFIHEDKGILRRGDYMEDEYYSFYPKDEGTA
ncbi:MAG: hypothetical protein Q4Q17_05135 [Tissierellia bacterium]|nr:hypothetical protein [Tissierellia bacterium]